VTSKGATIDSSNRSNQHPVREALLVVIVAGLVICAFVSWLLPGEKANAVLGRLSLLQFLWGSGAAILAIAGVIIVCLPISARRRYVFRMVAIGIGGLAALIVVEVCCWLLPAAPHHNPWLIETNSTIMEADDRLTYTRKPNVDWKGRSVGCLALEAKEEDPYASVVEFKTDYQGFRNGGDLTKADLIFIGDSHTEAGHVAEEDTFVQLTAQRLGVVARNLGRIQYCPGEELVVLKEYGLPCEPRTVVWQICEHNDLWEQASYEQWLTADSPSIYGTLSPRIDAWKRRSPTWRLFDLCCEHDPWPFAATFTDDTGAEHRTLFGNFPSIHQCPVDHPGWRPIAACLSEGARLLQEKNIRLVVVLIPMKIRVMGDYVTFVPETLRRMRAEWDIPDDKTFSRSLQAVCDSLQISFVDATPHLRHLTENGKMVFPPFDTHLSPLGNKAIADLIVPIIAGDSQKQALESSRLR
jgi:hypothetical protein